VPACNSTLLTYDGWTVIGSVALEGVDLPHAPALGRTSRSVYVIDRLNFRQIGE
jgi:hypothetical protein